MDNRERTLSIVVPAYCVEEYLDRCLKSLEKEIAKLDVIIVNDGSTDNTLKIAKSWQKKYPKNITVIDKENGGHGSVINSGLKIAKGKYFRVLDADDWLNQETLQKYLKILDSASEDLVLTNYTFNYVATSEKTLTNTFDVMRSINSVEDIAKLPILDHDFISTLSIHSCTIKTSALKAAWGDGLLEKTFYEDQEYVAKVLLAANSSKVYDIDVYQYMIGRDEQSMSKDKMFKHRADHAKVLYKLAEMSANCQNLAKRTLLQKRIREIYKTHYWIYFYHPGLTKAEKAEFKSFKNKASKLYSKISNNISIKFKLQLFLGRHKAVLK